LSQAAAILGSFIAVGQTGSQIVIGYYQHKIEVAKAQQQITLEKQKSDSALAAQFLTMILDKQTADKDRALLFDALAGISGHPLQAWATSRHEAIEKSISQLTQSHEAEIDALQNKDDRVRQVQALEDQIQSIGIRIQLVREDIPQTEELQSQRRTLSEQLAKLKGDARRAEATVAVRILGSEGAPAASTVVSFSLPIDRLRQIFPFEEGETGRRQQQNFDRYMPFLASALVEYGLTTKQRAAAVVATVWHETGRFRTVTEYSSGLQYEGRLDLGNVEAGDGERYKGRGLIPVMGRTNYARFSQKLGLGTRLVDSPEDITDPDVTSRIVCLWFQERHLDQFADSEDLQAIRRGVNGGLNGLPDFVSLYHAALAVM
jgi:putative chitinase